MHTAFWMYRDANQQWRWSLYAGNNRMIANSGEAYHNKSDCLHAISIVRGSGDSPVYEQ